MRMDSLATYLTTVATLLAAAGCSGEPKVASGASQVDADRFGRDALVKEPEVTECQLTTGEPAQCLRLVLKYKPDKLEIGPFCPSTLNEVGGIWDWDGEKPGVYRLNRTFFEMLKGLGYEFYDANETVHISDPAAGPPAFKNACLVAKAATC
jgi:hypothetical protein